MKKQIVLDEVMIEVELKNVKHVRLSVNPPDGRVRISAPFRTDMQALRQFALGKLGWIRKHRQKFLEWEQVEMQTLPGKISWGLWGKRYSLEVVEGRGSPAVELLGERIILRVRPGTGRGQQVELLEAWYRQQLRQAAEPLVDVWQQRMGVQMEKLFIQRMKTRWGSCNPRKRHIRLNTALAERQPELLEYVIVHELAHLIEPSHNQRFKELMERYLPGWKEKRQELKSSYML